MKSFVAIALFALFALAMAQEEKKDLQASPSLLYGGIGHGIGLGYGLGLGGIGHLGLGYGLGIHKLGLLHGYGLGLGKLGLLGGGIGIGGGFIG